ncbi:hypothetical protein M422DRAFT_259263 [Sphaerobolus stellatus SS14]|uniref:Uncharacterized protein n=1 Tax=Sphaerobolus stellatus (strain SS14) TaxID=990650 RepID=A0A0C9UTA0_SPHS4|nr:hypothetical protein M422DRAFT_259263 [Sphaerobolus stellatus SS14]
MEYTFIAVLSSTPALASLSSIRSIGLNGATTRDDKNWDERDLDEENMIQHRINYKAASKGTTNMSCKIGTGNDSTIIVALSSEKLARDYWHGSWQLKYSASSFIYFGSSFKILSREGRFSRRKVQQCGESGMELLRIALGSFTAHPIVPPIPLQHRPTGVASVNTNVSSPTVLSPALLTHSNRVAVIGMKTRSLSGRARIQSYRGEHNIISSGMDSKEGEYALWRTIRSLCAFEQTFSPLVCDIDS